MDELPRRLAAGVSVLTNSPVLSVAAGRVTTADAEWLAEDVIVAVEDPSSLVPTASATRWRALTTWYFAAADLPRRHPMLLVSPDVRLANVAVMSDVAPSYAPAGRRLIAASAVGFHDSAEAELWAREDAARMLAVAPGDLELIAHYPIAAALPAVGAAPVAGGQLRDDPGRRPPSGPEHQRGTGQRPAGSRAPGRLSPRPLRSEPAIAWAPVTTRRQCPPL